MGKRYEFLTSNMVESMNSCLRKARELPIVALIEIKRAKMAEFFLKHNAEAMV